MQNPSPPPPPPPPKIPEMDPSIAVIPEDPSIPSSASSLFDWSDFLDFGLDEPLSVPYDPSSAAAELDHGQHSTSTHYINNTDQGHQPAPEPGPVQPEPQAEIDSGRVRKRDPRLVCSNFLAGRVPCACPELDKMLEEEETGGVLPPGKKRVRTGRASSAGAAGAALRCQVPECEADISELKGYHKRHRVCLRCANASYVVLDGESKRYCQQCGKFHVLSDFDEGKRSCRRKLERHNNRRRRKPTYNAVTTEKEHEQIDQADDVCFDDDTGTDAICLSSKPVERYMQMESDGQLSTLCSANGSHIIQSDSVVSYTASGEAPIEIEKDNLKYNHSPTYCDNKSAFSSLCPTGRISFKLYDWNPAEFPRRLRLQIFQWLASMPVELEGYIRPGCTIFTVFIAMPKVMWVKLLEEPAPFIHNFIISPENMLNGRGTLLVYLENMIFRVIKEGTSVIKVKVKEMAPKLHYIHPTFFEAGKPIEFVVCGSNLLQPKVRFLLSFAGKYLACEYCVSSSFCGPIEGGTKRVDHQVVKIYVPQTASDLLGPAFVEVENESGLSNFIPILVGDKEICAEMKRMQKSYDASLSCIRPEFAATDSSCKASVLRQVRISQFIMDVAWSLKEPVLENLEIVAPTQLQRFNHLIQVLIENESTIILVRVLRYMEVLVDTNFITGISDADMRLFQSNMNIARERLTQKHPEKHISGMLSKHLIPGESSSSQSSCLSPIPATSQGLEIREKRKVEARMDFSSLKESSMVPLLDGEVVMSVNVKEWRGTTSSILTNRPIIFIIAAAAVCFGLCAVFLHPQKVEVITSTIRRCVFTDS